MRCVFAFLIALALPAFAAEPEKPHLISGGKDGNDAIELYESAGPLCESARMKRAVYRYKHSRHTPQFLGTSVEGCYVIQGDRVVLFFSDGDAGQVPATAFRIAEDGI